MTRARSLLASLLVAALTLLVLPGTARAADVGSVAAALLKDPVYVDPGATAQVDRGRLEDAVDHANGSIYVAVLPAAAASANGGPTRLTQAIGARLGDAAVLFTVAGTALTGGAGISSGLRGGEAQQIASQSSGSDLTARLVDSIGQAGAAVRRGDAGSSGSRGHGLLALVVLAGVALAGYLFVRTRRRRRAALKDMEGSRADVESLYGRLGADVANLSPGDDAVARQALADASERYTAAGALMAKADTPLEWAAARRTVAEGLAAARTVRTRLGLDPGPDVPPAPGSGPQIERPGPVQVGSQVYDAYPTYSPGHQHYWGGGYVGGTLVPGGWYGSPFWEGMLLGGVLSGGFGGGGYGYGYGGYEQGYEQGVDDARDARDASGGGWDPSGSDWGGGGGDAGGGGDWGGGGDVGGGGGDWGGGGGDSGGGGSW